MEYLFSHRKDAKCAEIIDFPFAVERTAKGNSSVPLSGTIGVSEFLWVVD